MGWTNGVLILGMTRVVPFDWEFSRWVGVSLIAEVVFCFPDGRVVSEEW